jgi:hypothetical protein
MKKEVLVGWPNCQPKAGLWFGYYVAESARRRSRIQLEVRVHCGSAQDSG